MKTIALCLNIPELSVRKPTDLICQKYPGSGWIPYLHLYAPNENVVVMCGADALEMVSNLDVDPSDLYVIQEELNDTGLKLVEMGAKPWLMFCLEAPLFTPFFYDKLKAKFSLITMFKHRLFFGDRGTEPVYFPSFDLDDLQDPEPYFSRKKICGVISNKHYSQYQEMFGHSDSWQRAVKSQLHDLRYATIGKLVRSNAIDLFGKGWPDDIGKELPPGEKLSTIRHYQQNLCGENMVMEGYITEKIIEAMVAGTVPIYAGAPDIADYIDPDCYPGHHMKEFDPLDVIAAGQKFLRSPQGRKFSYQGWAEHILELLAKEDGNHDPYDGNNRTGNDTYPKKLAA